MPSRKAGVGARKSTATTAASRKTATKRARPASRKSATASRSASVIMQARIDRGFAQALVEHDAVVLGLDGPSALVREGLRLVHERAREAAMVAGYDDFYAEGKAPLPAGVAPAGRG